MDIGLTNILTAIQQLRDWLGLFSGIFAAFIAVTAFEIVVSIFRDRD